MAAAAQFLADLHLCESVPKLTKTFLDFLENAENTAPLFILGDLFDCWVGDDQLTMPFYQKIAECLKQCERPKFLMRGNRDFLLGEKFAEESGVSFLADPFEIEIAGKKLLLSHGDQFCTDSHTRLILSILTSPTKVRDHSDNGMSRCTLCGINHQE